MHPVRLLLSSVLAASAVIPCSLRAQERPPPPPGRLEQDIKPPPAPLPRDPLRIDRRRFAEQAPSGAEQLRFSLGDVELVGNSALDTPTLAAAWRELLGKSISLADAFAIAAKISARYRDAGYILSQAVIPAQDLRTDVPATLRIEVLEGRIDQVIVTGIDAAALRPRLAAVQRERPLRLETLERSLLLIGELPGIGTQATLKPGAQPNTSDLELLVERDPREFSLSVHNRTAPSQGDIRFDAAADFRGVLTAFDRHNLRWVGSGTKRLNLFAYTGETPIGIHGLKAQLAVSTSRTEPSSEVGNLDTRSDSVLLGLAYPVVRSRAASVVLRAQLGAYNNRSETVAATVSRERIRTLRVGVTADHADALAGVSLFDLELAKGLSGLGASSRDDPLLLEARPDFTKVSAYAARLQALGGAWSLLFAMAAQHSGDKLPPAEQLGLGGETFLRGYDPSEAIGENGLAGKLELRCDTRVGMLASTLYAFADAGRVRRKQTAAPDIRTDLSSAGLGWRFSTSSRVRGFVEVAKPLEQAVASQGDKDARMFAGLGIDF